MYRKICDIAQMQDNWGIYVHVPWCRRRCPYCDFFFEVGKPTSDYISQLLQEFEKRSQLWAGRVAKTVYFGGGTPSLMSPENIARFLAAIERSGRLGRDAEITLEANPEDLTEEKVKAFAQAGVNRLSLGIQSFDDNILKQLGRKHRARQAFEAVAYCSRAQISDISVDLIFGVPGEAKDDFASWIQTLKELGVNHISAYLLTVEPGTTLEKLINAKKREDPGEDMQSDAYEAMQELMKEKGFRQYEVSSYALPGNESAHNRNYWGKGPYLGLGPSAHSMRVLSDGRVERSKNKSSILGWKSDLSGSPLRETEILENTEAFLESVAFGLRDLVLGVSLEELSMKHQCSIPRGLQSVLNAGKNKGWLVSKKEDLSQSIYLTQVGVRFADAIARDILSLTA